MSPDNALHSDGPHVARPAGERGRWTTVERPQLTDIEDRTLAMAEDEYVHFKTARPVLGTYYERNICFGEISAIVGRLSTLGFIRWRIRQHNRFYFRKRAPQSSQHNCSAAFTVTTTGKSYLAFRRVA